MNLPSQREGNVQGGWGQSLVWVSKVPPVQLSASQLAKGPVLVLLTMVQIEIEVLELNYRAMNPFISLPMTRIF